MEFVIWDESIADRDGDRILLDGLEFSNFEKNPVMFFNHVRGSSWTDEVESLVIGKWSNIRREGSKLLATPVFDMNDPAAAEIARKVEEGFLNACSIGFRSLETSDAMPYIPGQRYPTIVRAELLEVSIVEIPANQNAVRQKSYQVSPKKTVIMNEKELKEMQSKLSEIEKSIADIRAKDADFEKLKAENEALKSELAALSESQKKLADETARVKSISLAEVVETIKAAGAAHPNEDRSSWTVFDWQQKDAAGLEKLKSDNPEKYSSIIKKLR